MNWIEWASAIFLGGCVVYVIVFSFVVLSDKLPRKRKRNDPGAPLKGEKRK